jgi:hypothetical protein
MQVSSPFNPIAAARRQASEPDWRRFPSLWQTFPAKKAGFLDALVQLQSGDKGTVTSAITIAEVERFFAERAPQTLYPYVWVRNAVNPVPDCQGMHDWLHEVLVSYNPEDMPQSAPIRFENGQLVGFSVNELNFGKTRRYNAHNQDLVRQFCAYAHLGPAEREMESADDDDPMLAPNY